MREAFAHPQPASDGRVRPAADAPFPFPVPQLSSHPTCAGRDAACADRPTRLQTLDFLSSYFCASSEQPSPCRGETTTAKQP